MKPTPIPIAPWIEKAWTKRIDCTSRIVDGDNRTGAEAPGVTSLEATSKLSRAQEILDQTVQSFKIARVAAADLGALASRALLAADLEKAINQESSGQSL